MVRWAVLVRSLSVGMRACTHVYVRAPVCVCARARLHVLRDEPLYPNEHSFGQASRLRQVRGSNWMRPVPEMVRVRVLEWVFSEDATWVQV